MLAYFVNTTRKCNARRYLRQNNNNNNDESGNKELQLLQRR